MEMFTSESLNIRYYNSSIKPDCPGERTIQKSFRLMSHDFTWFNVLSSFWIQLTVIPTYPNIIINIDILYN